MTNHDPQEESETQFHYPAGKFDDEVVETSPAWAADDFNTEEFDYDFDE